MDALKPLDRRVIEELGNLHNDYVEAAKDIFEANEAGKPLMPPIIKMEVVLEQIYLQSPVSYDAVRRHYQNNVLCRL